MLKITIPNIIQDHQDMSDHWYLWLNTLSMVIGLLVVKECISIAGICTLARKLKITRKSKDTITRDLEILEGEVTTRKDIVSTSQKTWAHQVDSIKVKDQQRQQS